MLRTLFKAFAASPLSQAIRASSWAFAVTEMFHLMMLALFGGALLLGAVGLTGLAFKFPDRAGAWRGLRGVAAWTFLGLVLSGFLLVGSNPMKYYFHPAFRVKMLLLAVAVAAWIGLDRRVDRADAPPATLTGAMAATVLTLWLGVALAGRAIGLF